MQKKFTTRHITDSIYEVMREEDGQKPLKKSEIRNVVRETIWHIRDALVKGEIVYLHDFGVLRAFKTRPRVGRNIATKEMVSIPISARVRVFLSEKLREDLRASDTIGHARNGKGSVKRKKG